MTAAESVPLCLLQLDGQLHVLPGAPEKLDGIISAPSQKQLLGQRRTAARRSPPLSFYTRGSARKCAWESLVGRERKVEKPPEEDLRAHLSSSILAQLQAFG